MEPIMNKRTDASMLTEGLHPLDIDALVEARHPDPFSKLGLHQTDAGPVVRVLVPGASGVQVLERDGSKPLGTLTQVHAGGLFVGFIDEAVPYRLNIDWHGTPQEIIDPYSFGPVLEDAWLERLSWGDPYAVMECLGSRPAVHGGVAGVRFAVWAPNARRVSVVGDFNTWDGRRNPMRLRHNVGVWELFIPGIGAGTRYKYEIVSREGHTLPLKADPCAMQSERPPATASVVADADAIDGYTWTDGDWMNSRGWKQTVQSPISVYEVHAESWLRVLEEGNRGMNWHELAERLIPYAKSMGFTHLEFMPIAEHHLAVRGDTSRLGSSRRRRVSAGRNSLRSSSIARTKRISA
jgi:1,4-alpha-glucan branching enzyme